jgi:hypothetical protein
MKSLGLGLQGDGAHTAFSWGVVCTENLDSEVMVMKSTKDRG